MKSVAYNNEKTLIECNPLQFYSLRSYLVDILEVTVTEWNKNIRHYSHSYIVQRLANQPLRLFIRRMLRYNCRLFKECL